VRALKADEPFADAPEHLFVQIAAQADCFSAAWKSHVAGGGGAVGMKDGVTALFGDSALVAAAAMASSRL